MKYEDDFVFSVHSDFLLHVYIHLLVLSCIYLFSEDDLGAFPRIHCLYIRTLMYRSPLPSFFSFFY